MLAVVFFCASFRNVCVRIVVHSCLHSSHTVTVFGGASSKTCVLLPVPSGRRWVSTRGNMPSGERQHFHRGPLLTMRSCCICKLRLYSGEAGGLSPSLPPSLPLPLLPFRPPPPFVALSFLCSFSLSLPPSCWSPSLPTSHSLPPSRSLSLPALTSPPPS